MKLSWQSTSGWTECENACKMGENPLRHTHRLENFSSPSENWTIWICLCATTGTAAPCRCTAAVNLTGLLNLNRGICLCATTGMRTLSMNCDCRTSTTDKIMGICLSATTTLSTNSNCGLSMVFRTTKNPGICLCATTGIAKTLSVNYNSGASTTKWTMGKTICLCATTGTRTLSKSATAEPPTTPTAAPSSPPPTPSRNPLWGS